MISHSDEFCNITKMNINPFNSNALKDMNTSSRDYKLVFGYIHHRLGSSQHDIQI